MGEVSIYKHFIKEWGEEMKKMMEEIHIIPSGHDKTLCGLDSKAVKGTSLGMCCTCKICSEECQKIIDRRLKNESR